MLFSTVPSRGQCKNFAKTLFYWEEYGKSTPTAARLMNLKEKDGNLKATSIELEG